MNRVNRRAELKAIGDARIDAVTPSLTEHRVFASESVQEPDRTLMRLQTAVGRFPAVGGNRIEVLDDTNRTLGLIRREIAAATSSIHLEYYLWKPDRTGTALRDLLIEKAEAGVAGAVPVRRDRLAVADETLAAAAARGGGGGGLLPARPRACGSGGA